MGKANAVHRWLIHEAARGAPDILSSRLEEEWLADLAFRGTALSRLSFALGCCWAARMIAAERARTVAPAVAPSPPARVAVRLEDGGFAYASLHAGTLVLIVGIHAALLCGLLPTL